MADESQVTILMQGSDAWNKWRLENRDIRIDLSHANLRGANLAGADLGGVDLQDAQLDGANLSEADLRANLQRANLEGANLQKADFSGSKFVSPDLYGTVQEPEGPTGADLRLANLREADLTKADFHLANLCLTQLWEAKLSGANLSEADVRQAGLSRADLRGADLRGADLRGTWLADADLTNAKLGHDTKLNGAKVEGCIVDRYQLERLRDFGGLTVGDRMSMNINDGVAKLRASYSGFLQWIHLGALAVFLFPYVWFLFEHWSIAAFGPTTAAVTIPLWKALLQFIFNGGENWQTGFRFHFSFVAFIFIALYNVMRGVLLWKTKQLELQQESTGLPAMFSLEGSRWGLFVRAANWTFVLYLAVALFNTVHFLTMEIPVVGAQRHIETILDSSQ